MKHMGGVGMRRYGNGASLLALVWPDKGECVFKALQPVFRSLAGNLSAWEAGCIVFGYKNFKVE
jgi:hypothetical protein